MSCIDYGEGVAGLVGRVPDEGGVTEAELAPGVVTPACDVLVVEDGAGVPLAGLDVDDVPSGRHREVWERLAGLEVAVPEPVEVVVPYAYESGLPPALHGPVLEQCAAVALAERGLRYVQRDPCVHEWQLIAHLVCLVPHVLCVADPQLAHVASAPALHPVSELERRGGAHYARVAQTDLEDRLVEVPVAVPRMRLCRRGGFGEHRGGVAAEVGGLDEHHHQEGEEDRPPLLVVLRPVGLVIGLERQGMACAHGSCFITL